MALAANTRLGPYQITAPLGAGGTGDVYKARDTRLNRDVAIKILRPGAAIDVARQVLAEARAAARLNHPNIATLHDVVEGANVDGVALPPFLVMEFVDGQPLSSIVAAGRCEVDRALDIGIQLTGALAAAHREGIIHRDVKPANVMITRDGAVKLLDLGLASVAASDPALTTRTSLDAAMAAERGGTPAYMAPEQLAGHVPDARTDVYGSGVLLFELLTGRRPFMAPDLVTLAVTVATSPVPTVSSVCPDVPAAVDAVVARAMAKDASQRFPSAAELRDALVAARAGRAQGTAGLPLWRRRVVQAIAALVVVSIALTAAWFGRGERHAAAPIAILPAVSAGDPVLETLGVGLVSMLRDNLASTPGLTVVTAAGLGADYRGAGRDLARASRELGAGYLIDLQLSGSASLVRVKGSLIETGRRMPVWQGSYESADPLSVDRWVSEQIAETLEEIGVVPRRLTATDRQRLRRLPTADAAAFAAYARGQALLDNAKGAPDVAAAIAALQDAVTRDGSFALARAALSQACVRMYGYTSDGAWITRAAAEADQALAIDPDRAQVHYSLATVYQDTGRLADALQHAQEAVRLSPASDEAHRLLGSLLASRGETEKAIGELDVAIQLRPNFARNHATLGYVLYKAARYRQAVAPYRRAAELQPTAANFAALGTALHASGNVEEAIGNYKHAVELGSDPRAYSNLAFSYYTAGRFDEALANWQEALRLDKAPPPIRYRNIGDAYQRLGREADARAAYAEAIARAERLLKVNPADVDQIATIAVCEAKLGRHDEAALRAAEALGLKPGDSDVLFKAAVVAALGGRPDVALDHLRKALAAGYPRAFARGDFDLQPLRNDPRFAALVAQREE